MDLCHLLLSSIDKNVIYDGHANTYVFTHIGHNLSLAPLPPPKLLKPELGKGSEKSLFMSET